jgi:hypothetical protein
LLKLFKELLLHTSGDVDEALSWLTELDRQYKLTTPDYGLADFIQDLKDQGFIRSKDAQSPGLIPAPKMELALRKKALGMFLVTLKKVRSGVIIPVSRVGETNLPLKEDLLFLVML